MKKQSRCQTFSQADRCKILLAEITDATSKDKQAANIFLSVFLSPLQTHTLPLWHKVICRSDRAAAGIHLSARGSSKILSPPSGRKAGQTKKEDDRRAGEKMGKKRGEIVVLLDNKPLQSGEQINIAWQLKGNTKLDKESLFKRDQVQI